MLITKITNTFLAMIDAYFGRTKPLAYPVKIHIELNDFCNLRCTMCGRQDSSIPKNTGEISFDLVKKLSPFFKRAVYVGLAGNGEPFLHSQIFDILKFIIKHKATPAVITNATLLTEDISSRLTELGPMLLQASIDSAVPHIYEKIRLGASYDKVRENLLNLKKRKEKKNATFPVVALISCLMKETINDIEKLVDLAHEIGAMEITFQNILPYNPDMKDSLINYFSLGEDAVNKAKMQAAKYGININYAPMGFGIDRFKQDKINGITPKYYCENIWDLLHIELTGKIRFCCFWSGEKLGDITKENPLDLWKSDKYSYLRKKLICGQMPEYCKNCHILVNYNGKAEAKKLFFLIKEIIRNNKHFKNVK